jgi:hypothetical protein
MRYVIEEAANLNGRAHGISQLPGRRDTNSNTVQKIIISRQLEIEEHKGNRKHS